MATVVVLEVFDAMSALLEAREATNPHQFRVGHPHK